jgi:chorismate mutase
MKKILIILCFLAIGFFARSQSMIAKIKYEDAEAAYQKGDYPLAITKLNETEAILKSSNPRILYLRVMAQYKMIENDMTNDADIIEKTRKLAGDYVTKYETVPNNEDKFREIYRAYEALNNSLKYAVPPNTFAGLLEQVKFKLNLNIDELKAYNPEVKELTDRVAPKGGPSWRDDDTKKGPCFMVLKNNKVVWFTTVIAASKNEAYLQKVFNNYSKLLYKLKPSGGSLDSTQTVVALDDMYIYVENYKGRVMLKFAAI